MTPDLAMPDDVLLARLREIIRLRLGEGYEALQADLRALLADVAIEYGERFYPEWTDERQRQMIVEIRARFGVEAKP